MGGITTDSSSEGLASDQSDGEHDIFMPVNRPAIVPNAPDQTGAALEQQVRSNPEIQQIVKAMVQEELRVELKKDRGTGTNTGSAASQTPKIPDKRVKTTVSLVKSPSDTTLYAPALRRVEVREDNLNRQRELIDKISNFVEDVRLEESAKRTSQAHDVNAAGNAEPSTSRSDRAAHKLAEKIVVQAEQFKASIAPPKGMDKSLSETDDDFFHITCHVDPSLKEKIEQGGFMELEKLLPKEQIFSNSLSDESRMEIVSWNGMTFFAQVQDKNAQITGLHKWEQAFRVYAAIYSQAQPHHASEIWQYMYVINQAAAAYQWENVAYYDFTFRQMMAQKPLRSWAKIYNQGWNLAMTDPLGRPSNSKTQVGGGGGSSSGGTGRSWKDNCCWKFNRNKCKKSNTDCDWDHRCTYCGGWGHGYFNCRKKSKKLDGAEHHNKGGNAASK